jgi:hypothetical protein
MINNYFKNRNSSIIKKLGVVIFTNNKTLHSCTKCPAAAQSAQISKWHVACGYSNLGSNFIHTSAILYSEKVHNKVDINDLLTEKVNDLQLVKYNDTVDKEGVELKDLNLSSYKEVFPWFVEGEGGSQKDIDFNKPIRLFDSVKLIYNYLEKRHNIDKNFLSEVTISKLIEPLKYNGEITVKEFFTHITKELKSGEYQDLIKKAHMNMCDDLNLNIKAEDINTNLINSVPKLPISNVEPLGQLGNTTINQVVAGVTDLKLNLLLNHSNVSLSVLPLAFNSISYTLILRSYLTHIHNRPYDPNLSANARRLQEIVRRRHLLGFVLIGAPLTLLSIRQAGLGLKDILSVEIKSDGLLNSVGEASNLQTTVSEENNSNDKINSLFLLLSNINKKIPNWIKLFFKLLFGGIVVLKLLGISVISVMTGVDSTFYLRSIVYTISILSITYQLLNLYFLYRFSQNNIKISEILPEFIIKWLKEFEIMCESKESLKSFKTECYIQISLYIVIIIIVTLIS